jgi:hypothetical protein
MTKKRMNKRYVRAKKRHEERLRISQRELLLGCMKNY